MAVLVGRLRASALSIAHPRVCSVAGRPEANIARERPQVSRGGGHAQRATKAPDINILARANLARGLRQHPDIAKHVERVEDVDDMGLWALLTLAKKMGVDSDEMIRKTEQEERALSHYSFKYPAFRGELPFDLTFTFFGKSVTRKAKVVYEHTPEWPY